jgi:two-component system, response regulator / RNA-binding antiterminator
VLNRLARELQGTSRRQENRCRLRVKILLADDDADRARYLARALARQLAAAVVSTQPGEMLPDAVATHQPDVVVVDMTRPDRDALDGVRQLSATMPHPVVMFVDQDDPDFMQAAVDAGVSSYNVGTVSPIEMKPILQAAVALFRRYQRTHERLTAAETQLRERDVVAHAKAILIRRRKFSEPQAYRWLRREAMASGKRIPEVAHNVVQAEEGES